MAPTYGTYVWHLRMAPMYGTYVWHQRKGHLPWSFLVEGVNGLPQLIASPITKKLFIFILKQQPSLLFKGGGGNLAS